MRILADHRALTRCLFAIGMAGLGALALVYGDFALQWEPVPLWVPARGVLAYLTGLLMVIGGGALLWRRTTLAAARVLFVYVVAWELILKIPRIFAAPLIADTWLGPGEIGILTAGAWLLFASVAGSGERAILRCAAGGGGRKAATILFGLALLPVGLSHLVYGTQTAALVPGWLPYRMGWAYLTGVGQIAAGLGVLFNVLPRAAAFAEAAMLTLFTLLVWLPRIVAIPTARLPWTAFAISWAIAAGAWVVATEIRR